MKNRRLTHLSEFLTILRKEKVPRLIIIFILVVIGAGCSVFYLEGNLANAVIKNIQDGIWWGFVTIFTVGYGDKYPITLPGRIVGIAAMFSGLVLTVLISAKMAAILVERKIREGKGLYTVELENHVIICGWNNEAHRIVEGLHQNSIQSRKLMKIILVNELDIDKLNEIQFTYQSKYFQVEILRGNFAQEQVLQKANAGKAESVIILSDTSGEDKGENADERTIFGCYTISNVFPGVQISAEINNPQNEQYLKNTNVENVIVSGEFNTFLMVNAAINPGIPRAARELMNLNVGNALVSEHIPGEFVGKNFSDLFDSLRKKGGKILVGIITESRKLSIDDFLSDDPSSIDDFIKRKFAESENDYFADTKGSANVMLNPGWDYEIGEHDKAIVIAKPEGGR